MKNIHIAKGISLPSNVVTQTIAILAKRRVGKSYTMRKITEELLKADQQIIIIDPKGDQWGIRASADGKGPGFPIVILGGEHGDAPLEASAGSVVAKLVAEERVSVLLDLSSFRKHEVATFMAIFLEDIYRLKAIEANRTPLMVIIDEADAIAPQKPQDGEQRMLGAAEDLVRRGGQRGLGCILITQRSAVLNKNVLTQAEMLIVLRTIAPHDLKAIKEWIDVHGTIEEGKTLIESLPSLPIGDAWFWSPGWPTEDGIFTRSRAYPITTFDSAATPKPGAKKIVPKNLADVDLNSLKKQMAETIEKAKSDDPKLLKKKIAELEKELVHKKSVDQSVSPQNTEKIVKDAVDEAIYSRDKEWDKKYSPFVNMIEKVKSAVEIIDTLVDQMRDQHRLSIHPIALTKYYPFPKDFKKIISVKPIKIAGTNTTIIPTIDGHKPLGKCARMVLSYLHQSYPSWKSKSQLWIATSYAHGGGFDNAIYELTSQGFIEKDGLGKYAAKQGNYDLSLIDQDFDSSVEKWNAKISLASRKIFQIIRENDKGYTKTELAEITGYAQGGGFDNAIYALTSPMLIIKTHEGYKLNPEILNL